MLAEADYRYGLGQLAVRVSRIIRETKYNNEPWWEVECTAKDPSYKGQGQQRFLYVRETALKIPGGWQSDKPA